jgi:uncharacterized protein YegL
MEQIAFGTNSFADNPEPRVPCVLLLDVSGSMNGDPIAELNEGLVTYRDELAADSLASRRVEVAIVTFGDAVEVPTEFTTAEGFLPPHLHSGGSTPMGAAIHRAVDMIEERKQTYKANGIAYYRPWLFLITDGGPTDEWRTAAERVHAGEAAKSFSFFAVGVEGANLETLGLISKRAPLKLKGLRFRDLFQWLSSSQQSVSKSSPGDDVPLENPTTPEGWASV